MDKSKNTLTKRQAGVRNRSNRKISGNINSLLDNINSMSYGVSRNDKVDALTDTFNDLMKHEIDDISKTSDGDTTSFITKLFSENNKRVATAIKDIEQIFNTEDGQLDAFLNEQYRNRLIKQADLHEVASQLIELQQAITITRDAIVSADIIVGHMSRSLTIDNGDLDTTLDDYIPIIENMEKKFKLQEKIKNFIIPRSLEYGEYFAYVIPYSKIFESFSKEKNSSNGKYMQYTNMYRENVLSESISDKDFNVLLESAMNDIEKSESFSSFSKDTKWKKDVKNELKSYLENISIVNDPIPLPILEEGVSSTKEYYTEFVERTITEDKKSISFEKIMSSIDSGVHSIGTGKKKKNKAENFSHITDCYIKMIDPIHLIPIKIMNEIIGYYYIQEEDITPLAGILTSTVYYDKFDQNRNENNLLSSIAETIVNSFDKKFLDKNIKFKKLIVESLNYFKLNNRKIKFQFIPKEYIYSFKINEDENGNGRSIIEPSLFYAKLYLMLLLFKIMTIIRNSNDTKVNYIRQSGLDANIINKIQEIARQKQQRQITLTDMFSYTTLINKVGQGNEMYIPVGQGNERGIETEILSGQDVQLNNELMEMLKKAYISGTGVPDVLMNYFNEADFAKTLELANNRFQGAVVSYQLDYNPQITELYKGIMKSSTSIPEDIIDSFNFNFIQPKYSNSNITNDLLNNHNAVQDFLLQLYYGQDGIDNPANADKIMKFKKGLAEQRLTMLDFGKIDELYKESNVEGTGESLNPNKSNNEEE